MPSLQTEGQLDFFKLSQINQCKLERIGDMPFDFDQGSCGTFVFPDSNFEQILLCFGFAQDGECHR